MKTVLCGRTSFLFSSCFACSAQLLARAALLACVVIFAAVQRSSLAMLPRFRIRVSAVYLIRSEAVGGESWFQRGTAACCCVVLSHSLSTQTASLIWLNSTALLLAASYVTPQPLVALWFVKSCSLMEKVCAVVCNIAS